MATLAVTLASFIRSMVSSREFLGTPLNAHGKPLFLLAMGCKGLKKQHLEVPRDTQKGRHGPCRGIPPTLRKGFPTPFRVELRGWGAHRGVLRPYCNRDVRIRRRAAPHIAGVTRPVCVFCWLRWETPHKPARPASTSPCAPS